MWVSIWGLDSSTQKLREHLFMLTTTWGGVGGTRVTPILQIRKLRLRAEVTCTMSHSQETGAGCEPIFQTPRPTYGLLARARGLLGMVGT